ncbi:hypothetical protein EI94DRAFT_766300 [Lactarius quietus]|nr:hypothetical protein EI94DRAFT_766300 [Lactarius quietus]
MNTRVDILLVGPYGATPWAVGVRPNATTNVMADANTKLRAKFVCPVLGCGSTFTRHFNLKGHLHFHDYKAVKCKWPGCGKGFVRLSDCKRHERLHSMQNHRQFTCDGCRNSFAQLDALVRHLRSEGGSGCLTAVVTRAVLKTDIPNFNIPSPVNTVRPNNIVR